ncbi:TPA: helix-turn-helix transcriptional regulator [Stenotrophomonas maltophilia]|nr:helix-turn-helix transcriptional regulator [Stenotrophomonas maltophilia]
MGRDFEQIKGELAANVRTLRRAQKMSQETLALSADVDRTYVSQIERSTGNPSLHVMIKLAKTLEVDLLDLLRQRQD